MPLRVVIHRLAHRDMDDYLAWLSRYAPNTAARWFEGLSKHLLALAQTAIDCAPAAESVKSSQYLRESHFGKMPNVFRVIFYIAGDSVHVIRVCRAQRRMLTRRQIQEAIDSEAEDDDVGR